MRIRLVLALALGSSLACASGGHGGTLFDPDKDGDGWRASLDCDDDAPQVNPDADEVCDEDDVDEDCNGDADNEDSFPEERRDFGRDDDGDGFGSKRDTVKACDPPPDYAALGGDCDDNDPAIHPEADEVCDGVDNDCDDEVDVGAVGTQWYVDIDGDGFGSAEGGTDCTPGADEVADGGDCDETDRDINPGEDEICNAIDDDCDGSIDDDDDSLDPSGADVYYTDADGDGFGDADAPIVACSQPSETVERGEDCDDTRAAVNPNAREVCDNGQDDDCSGDAPECAFDGAYDDADAAANIDGVGGVNSAHPWSIGDVDGDGATDFALTGEGFVAAIFTHLVSGGVDVDDADLVPTADPYGIDSVDTADVDGDGTLDLVVSYASHFNDEGVVWIEYGPIASGRISYDYSISGSNDYDRLWGGINLGDTNGDGTDDLILGAPGYEGSGSGEGGAFLFVDPVTGSTGMTSGYTMIGEVSTDSAGEALAEAGDVDGDGMMDILIGAPGNDTRGMGSAGAVYLFLGPVTADTYLSAADGKLTGSQAGTYLAPAAGAGDVDGDGHDDTLAWSERLGKAWLVEGPWSREVSVTAADVTFTGATADAFGTSGAIDGDATGDGVDDVLIGAPTAGKVWLYEGGSLAGAVATSAATASFTGTGSDGFGTTLAYAGDHDFSGANDILAGAPDTDADGRTWLFLAPGF